MFKEEARILKTHKEMISKERIKKGEEVEYPEFEKGTTFKKHHLDKLLVFLDVCSKLHTYLRGEDKL